mgnify:CR=1 FL=1
MKAVLNKIFNIGLNMVIILVVFCLSLALYSFVQVKVLNKSYANYFGYTYFHTISGSMEDEIKIDTSGNTEDIFLDDTLLVDLQKEIQDIGGKYYTDRIDLKKSSSEEIRPILDHFKNLTNIDSYEITDTDLKDGVKLMLGNKRKILVRPSGTEPLLRIYFETDSSTELEDLKNIYDINILHEEVNWENPDKIQTQKYQYVDVNKNKK